MFGLGYVKLNVMDSVTGKIECVITILHTGGGGLLQLTTRSCFVCCPDHHYGLSMLSPRLALTSGCGITPKEQ